jgi:hypothetical protein
LIDWAVWYHRKRNIYIHIHSLHLHHVNKWLCYKAVVKTEVSGPLNLYMLCLKSLLMAMIVCWFKFQLYSWQDQDTRIILVTLTRVPDYDRKFRLTRDKGPIHRDISPCNEPAKTTPTCYCYKLCFTYTKMWHLSELSFSTLLPPMGLKTCYEQNMS